MIGSMGGARRVIDEPWTIGGGGVLASDPVDRVIGQIVIEMVSRLIAGRLHMAGVLD